MTAVNPARESEVTTSDTGWSSDDGWSDTEDSEPTPSPEGTWQEWATWPIVPWSYPAGRVVLIMPGVSVLNWYLYTGGGKRGYVHAESGLALGNR